MSEIRTVLLRADLARKLLEMRHWEQEVGDYASEIEQITDNIIELNLPFANRVFEELEKEDEELG